MQKIIVTRQFFGDSGPRGHFFDKNKKPVFGYGLGKGVYQISGLYRFSFSQEAWHKQINKQNKQIYTRIQLKLGISSTGCLPPVDFDY